MAPKRSASSALLAAPDATSPNTKAGGIEGVSPLSKKFPPLKRTGDSMVDHRLQLQRNAFMKICDKLWAEPHLIIPTCMQLECGMIGPDGGAEAPSEFWDSEWSTLARLPKHWLAEFLIAQSKGELSNEDMNKVDIHDGDNIRNIFSFITGTRPNMPLLRDMLNKTICARTLAARAESIGNRILGFKKKAIDSNGRVNWRMFGCYKLDFNEAGIAIKVTHTSGAAYIPEQHQVITKQFQLIDPFYDGGCIARLGSTEHRLSTFFPAGEGPNIIIMNKKCDELKRLAAAASEEVEQARQVTEKGRVAENKLALKDAQSHRIAGGLRKAKETARQQKTKRARVLSLAD